VEPACPLAIAVLLLIVPAYNEEVGIERAVRSLTASDYAPLEVVVVDDGSMDATATIVDASGSRTFASSARTTSARPPR
jgi:glycosyltransferase involved in cell wall biosynthesis